MTLSSSPGVVTDPRPFHHLVPHYFSTKLPSLVALYIIGDKNASQSGTFPVPRSVGMDLGHFRSLTKLKLVYVQFQSLWDLRRLVISPPSLSSLWLEHVIWPSPFVESQRVPSLLITARRLSEVGISDTPHPWEALWFWTTSCTPEAVELSSQEYPYPALAIHDATTTGKLIQKFVPPHHTIEIHWSYNEGRQDWGFLYRDSECADNEKRATLKALKCAKTPRVRFAQSPIRSVPRIYRIHFLHCSTFLPPSDWKAIEELCNALQVLQGIHFSVSYSLLNHMGLIRDISRTLALLRARNDLSLSFAVDGIIVGGGRNTDIGHGTGGSSWEISPEERGRLDDIFSDDHDRQLGAGAKFRMLLLRDNSPTQTERVIKFGVAARLVQFLQEGLPMLQSAAAWALAGITSGTADHSQVLIDVGAVPELIKLISSPPDVQDVAVYALGNLTRSNPVSRDYILQAGVVPPLLALLAEEQEPNIIANATWTLSKLCQGTHSEPDWQLVSPTLPTLAKLIHSIDDDVLINVCCAISHLSCSSNVKIQAVIDSGVCKDLVGLLSHPSTSVQTPALRSIGNIASGDESQAQVVITSGALPALLSLLSSPKGPIRREACWTISNITAGTSAQIQAVIDANIIPSLINALHDRYMRTRKEACLAILNVTKGGLEELSQIQELVSHGCIEALCDLLTTGSPVTQVALDALDNILAAGEVDEKVARGAVDPYALRVKEAGGVVSMDNLRRDNNPEISEQASTIVESYFPRDGAFAGTSAPPPRAESVFGFIQGGDLVPVDGSYPEQ